MPRTGTESEPTFGPVTGSKGDTDPAVDIDPGAVTESRADAGPGIITASGADTSRGTRARS